jgi:hypothetical protein
MKTIDRLLNGAVVFFSCCILTLYVLFLVRAYQTGGWW